MAKPPNRFATTTPTRIELRFTGFGSLGTEQLFCLSTTVSTNSPSATATTSASLDQFPDSATATWGAAQLQCPVRRTGAECWPATRAVSTTTALPDSFPRSGTSATTSASRTKSIPAAAVPFSRDHPATTVPESGTTPTRPFPWTRRSKFATTSFSRSGSTSA